MPAHLKRTWNLPRLKPPATLSPRAAEIFKRLVRSVDADHFRSVDMPLLAQYCVACAQADEASEKLAAEGAVIDGKASPWLAVQEKSMRAAAVLSTKLRCAPISRFDRTAAAANSREHAGKRPWEDDDEDDGLLAKPPRGLAAFR